MACANETEQLQGTEEDGGICPGARTGQGRSVKLLGLAKKHYVCHGAVCFGYLSLDSREAFSVFVYGVTLGT